MPQACDKISSTPNADRSQFHWLREGPTGAGVGRASTPSTRPQIVPPATPSQDDTLRMIARSCLNDCHDKILTEIRLGHSGFKSGTPGSAIAVHCHFLPDSFFRIVSGSAHSPRQDNEFKKVVRRNERCGGGLAPVSARSYRYEGCKNRLSRRIHFRINRCSVGARRGRWWGAGSGGGGNSPAAASGQGASSSPRSANPGATRNDPKMRSGSRARR